MSALFQWEQKGPFRPMTPDGRLPAGDCVELPEPHAVLMGSGITDENGFWHLDVRPAACVNLAIVDWVSMVATPSYRGEEGEGHPHPLFVTTSWTALGGNLTLYVRSWAPNGELAPKVPFSWHAAVVQHLE